ncbi:MAG: polysaccharide deacetylase family protein [Pseudomonadales bacterium]
MFNSLFSRSPIAKHITASAQASLLAFSVSVNADLGADIDLIETSRGTNIEFTAQTISAQASKPFTARMTADNIGGVNALQLVAAEGYGEGLSGVQLTFDESRNLHDFWRVRYQLKSSASSDQVRLALELVTRSPDHEGTTIWRQKADSQVTLADICDGWVEVDTAIHVNEFSRRPDTKSNGSLLELSEVVAVNVVMVSRESTEEHATVNIDAIEFYDESPYSELSSELERTEIGAVSPTLPSEFGFGSQSRMAVYITDTDSSWLAFVAALKNIGIPVKVVPDLAEALTHDTVVVYPRVSRRDLSAADISSVREYVRSGGALIGLQLVDTSMNDVFGIQRSVNLANDPDIRDIKFDTENYPQLTDQLDHEFERRVSIYRRLGEDDGIIFTAEGPDRIDRLSPEDNDDGLICGYETATADVIAIYDNEIDEDDTGNERAAITRHPFGNGVAYSLAWDVGYQAVIGQSLEYAPMGRFYSDAYSPGFDVIMKFFKDVYQKESDTAVTLHTVPEGKDLSVIITHDIDGKDANVVSTEFAQLEQDYNVPATYFWQTRYMNDARDMRFFDSTAIAAMNDILEHSVGHEIGSHGISHAFDFSNFKIGDAPQFPDYAPRSLLKDNHEELPETRKYVVDDGTVLGEMKISKFLVEEMTGQQVQSFRPGHLSYPIRMNEIAEATGYAATSTTTAPYSSTNLPYLMTYLRSTGFVQAERKEQLLDLVEIPLSWEDVGKNTILRPEHAEDSERLGMMEPEFLEETEEFLRQLSQYGGVFNLLIHPTELGLNRKLEYQRYLLELFQPENALANVQPHFSTVRAFGDWWLARFELEVDVTINDTQIELRVKAARDITGVALQLHDDWHLLGDEIGVSLSKNRLVIDELSAGEERVIRFTLAENAL